MKLSKTKLSEDEVSTEINLEKLLGSQSKNREVREAFFQVAYDKLLERLDQGIGADGKKLGKYSKAYMDSLAYAAFGKDSTVNMQLSGDMISSIDIVNQDDKKMKVAFKGQDENAKAFAHMTGFQGHPTLDGKVKPRKFFGWSDDELLEIAQEFKPRQETRQSAVSDAQIISLFDRLFGEDNG